MKVLSIEEAKAQFAVVCEEALAGELIRLQLANGALLELTPMPAMSPEVALSDRQLAQCYADTDWADFENHCGKASD